MMLILKIAALVLVTGLLTLTLRHEQPAFAFLVSVCGAGAVLALVAEQMQPLLAWIEVLADYGNGTHLDCVLRVLGVALVAQFATDLCREAGLGAAAGAAELGGRMLALLQAMPLVQELIGSLVSFLR